MFEEVKEMIDSTIYTNGRGEVTAQNINLAMNGMVDVVGDKFAEVDDAVKVVEEKVTALEQNGSASSGPLIVYMGVMEETEDGVTFSQTEEEKAHNAEVFQVIKDAKCLINIFLDNSRSTNQMIEQEGIVLPDDSRVCFVIPVIMQTYSPYLEGLSDEQITLVANTVGWVNFSPDGTLTSMN